MPTAGAARARRDPRRAPASPTSRSPAAAVFDTAVKRGVESPWERIRALKARTKTPLAMALRGRFLVGSRPVGGDFVRRFVASAAESGIDVFRLHDPLNDVSNLREAGEAITAAGRELDAGLVYSPGPAGETDTLVEQAQRLPELGAARVLIHDPSGSLEPHRAQRARRGDSRGERAAGRPLLPGRRRHRARGRDRGGPRRRRPDRGRRLPGRARPAPGIRRGARRGARRARPATGRRHRRALGASDLVDEHIGDEPVAPLAPRIAVRAAEHEPSAGPRRRARRAPARARRGRPARRGARRARAHPRRGRLAAARGADRPDPRLAGAPARALGRALPDGRRRAPRPARRAATARRPGRSTRRSSGRSSSSPTARSPRRTRARPRRAARATPRARRERGGAAPARPLRRGGRAAPAHDPRPRRAARSRCERSGVDADAGRADPRDRPDRPGDRASAR